jgi:hypothetical protein
LAPQPVITLLGQQRPNGVTWVPEGALWCPGANQPVAVAPNSIRAEAIKLLPTVAVGTAPVGRTLINIQTLLWAATAPTRDLGTPTITGHRVPIRVHFVHADWDFGDGTTGRTASPGKAYDRADPCTVPVCPDYQGHTFTETGMRVISVRVTWTAQYRIDAGAWQSIAGTITGPTGAATITVRQARGVLVANPGG